ncbi:hypothetical protein B0H10DRAFT_2241278 [Mycena sp. CBHHK59/15]|nr:hypothetical protein B0H10DRAFT_2241278 [Mycena sp. CBHHK59/15]
MDTGNPNLIVGDAEAEQNSLDISEAAIPKAIFTLTRAGISPPLTLFALDALQRIRSGWGTKSVKVTMEIKDSAHLLDITLFPNKNNLDQANWTTSYNSFLKFIQCAYGTKICLGFVQHFEAMMSDSEFKAWFSAYWDFDTRLCSQFFTKAFIIDPTDDKYGKLLQAAKNRSLRQAPLPTAGASSSVGPVRTEKTHTRGGPYEKQKKNSFREVLLCLRFGRSDGHQAADCMETQPSWHGHQFIIHTNGNGLFRIGTNAPVCFTYNLTGECKFGGGTHAVHVCSLCAGDHGAICCTRN